MTEELHREAYAWARERWGNIDPSYEHEPAFYAVIVKAFMDRGDWDHRLAQYRAIDAALSKVKEYLPHRDTPWPTIVEENQVVFHHLDAAVAAAKLVVDETRTVVDVGIGIGYGAIMDLGKNGDGRPLQDGPGWWAARDAVNTATQRRVYDGYSRIMALMPPSIADQARALVGDGY